jgi:hypothetical protein
MASVEDAAERLGISPLNSTITWETSARQDLAPSARIHEGALEENKKDAQPSTAGTTAPHLLTIAEVDVVASLQIWQGSLRAAQPE